MFSSTVSVIERHGKASLGDESSRQPFSRAARCACSCEGRPGPNGRGTRRDRGGTAPRSAGDPAAVAAIRYRVPPKPGYAKRKSGGSRRGITVHRRRRPDRAEIDPQRPLHAHLRFGSILASSPRLWTSPRASRALRAGEFRRPSRPRSNSTGRTRGPLLYPTSRTFFLASRGAMWSTF